ncbi:glutamate--tRNA ligase [Deinococcus yavapaiensis]|uniref:Glutamate--tRNA ligase n=1 Tax=Deinococcus yavapaiensis KR-236 TaxID=694435 RepID=A0A318SFJ5_9DEIO|nr:glutamate--tRNA ligase [Deinococcus yavapaiensis]PYE56214.1 glutamyl-tRNA synthetase [Deinococcus yavapaiensis KR-236]
MSFVTSRRVTTRIAPSPTGDPHVGTAYQALYNFVFARQHGGKFVVRIEDTDRTRYNAASEGQILAMLDWLGLTPDASPAREDDLGPYTQSLRAELHREHAVKLVESGHAYRAFDTPEELEARRKAAIERGEDYRGYDRRDRDLPQEESERRAASGETFVIRLKVPLDGETIVNDELRGEVRFDNRQLDDKVLLKADGFPTYHLAAMVDDHLMGVTHVIRAEEWLTSTPIHVLILRALEWDEPTWIHTPLLRNPDKSKLSKRKSNTSVQSYREMGVLPEALLNYLGMMGWSHPDGAEVFGVDDMVRLFSWDRVSLGGPVFDLAKLKWLNGKYLREVLSAADVAERLHAFLAAGGYALPNDEYFRAVVVLMTPRIETFSEFMERGSYFFDDAFTYDAKAQKALADGANVLGELRDALADAPAFDAGTLEATLRAFADSAGLKIGKVMQPLRAAVAGTMESPGMFELLETLGRGRVVARLNRAIEGRAAS